MTVTARQLPSPAGTSKPAAGAQIAGPVSEGTSINVCIPALVHYLGQVPDPRKARGRRHPLAAILALLCLALLSGVHGYLPARDWGSNLAEEDRRALGFTRANAPAASTLWEVLRRVSWEALETQLREWVVAVEAAVARGPALPAPAPSGKRRYGALPLLDERAVAIDGKALRGSFKRGAEIAAMLAVVRHHLANVVAQEPMRRKDGELTAVRPLLLKLVLTGLVVTVDAQFTQPDLAATIGAQGGDYLMRVKGNQPILLANIRTLLSPRFYAQDRRASISTYDEGHGRVETRQLIAHTLTPEEQEQLEWPQARQVFAVTSWRRKKGQPPAKPKIIYGVTSLAAEDAGPERLLRLFRGHWTVENRAFWVRDVVTGEDRSPATTQNVVAVLACLRGAVLNVLRFTQGNAGMAKTVRRYNANRKLALAALGCA